MKQIKHTDIKWVDFFKNIVLKRSITKTQLKYIGEFRIGKEFYTDSLEMGIETYRQNEEDIEYIDNFAKEQIAKKIMEKINRN